MKHMEVSIKRYITRNKLNNSVNTWQMGTISPTLEKASTILGTDNMGFHEVEEDEANRDQKLTDERTP